MEKRVDLDTGLDRISDLPEPVRRHILSFLKTWDGVRASILSSSWRGLWTGSTCLDLSKFYLPGLLTLDRLPLNDENNATRSKWEKVVRMRAEFYNFLDRTLGSIRKLEKLDLYVPGFGPELVSRFDHWLDCVVRCNVKELALQIGPWEGPKYSLPKSVLGANSITKLKLTNCELVLSSLTDTQLPSLRDLSLEYVVLDDVVMISLLSSCPVLEELSTKNCNGLSRLEVSGLTKLKEVYVEHLNDELEGVWIDARNLLKFTYVNEGNLEYPLCEIQVTACKNLVFLKLVGSSVDDDSVNTLLAELPVLEHLALCHCNELANVEISSQHLIHLEFLHCLYLKDVKIDTPNLNFFHYWGEDPVSFSSKGLAPKLMEASVYLKSDNKGDKWYVRLVKFLAKLSHAERLTLHVGNEEDVVVPERVRTKFSPPLYCVKHLMVELRASFLKHTHVKLIEALLWLAPCTESISIHNDYIPVCKFLKFKYENTSEGKNVCGCFKSLRINCWRHSLKEVRIENVKGAENDSHIAAFFDEARTNGSKITCFFDNSGPQAGERRDDVLGYLMFD